MTQRYVLTVRLPDREGFRPSVRAWDNYSADTDGIEIEDVSKAPAFVAEKIALLRMCQPHKEGGIGLKINDQMLTIYLTKDEYNILKENSNGNRQ
jgi:hypothetical protein